MKAFEEVIAGDDERSFQSAYASFLGEAVVILHCYGRLAESHAIYRHALSRYPEFDQNVSYDDFIGANFNAMQANADDLPPPDAVAIVEGYLFQACLRNAAGDSAAAAENERRAREFWGIYMQARAGEDHRQRTRLPELDILRRQAERRAREETIVPAMISRKNAQKAQRE
jgi:hypothetical protein